LLAGARRRSSSKKLSRNVRCERLRGIRIVCEKRREALAVRRQIVVGKRYRPPVLQPEHWPLPDPSALINEHVCVSLFSSP
jgi:hypothetical protein